MFFFLTIQNHVFKTFKYIAILNSVGDKMPEGFITFADWERMDVRVGTIIEAKQHPNADKLIVLKIDEGKEEPRQLVAGIKGHYKEDELVGKQIVFLANLEPKELRGELSRGMILAADDGDMISLLTVDKPVRNNAKVR